MALKILMFWPIQAKKYNFPHQKCIFEQAHYI